MKQSFLGLAPLIASPILFSLVDNVVCGFKKLVWWCDEPFFFASSRRGTASFCWAQYLCKKVSRKLKN
jgi:hypothetical protein